MLDLWEWFVSVSYTHLFDCSFEGEGFPMGLHRLFAVSEKAAEPTAVSVNVFAVMLGALLVTLVASQLIRLALAHSSYRRSYWRCRPGLSLIHI